MRLNHIPSKYHLVYKTVALKKKISQLRVKSWTHKRVSIILKASLTPQTHSQAMKFLHTIARSHAMHKLKRNNARSS